ncbi:MAG: hypothetical protein M1827_007500 [Pycnora praestabilis]|nr:MAG: hypothetical protein M1827_007500 [Pycnora praestabilis]
MELSTEYKKIHDSSFWGRTSVDRKMKAFAYVVENLNAEAEKHIKKGKEGRVKSEVHERFVGRPLVVEEWEGEMLDLARQVEELQAKSKHLRGLAQEKGDDIVFTRNTDNADEARAAEAAVASSALEVQSGPIFGRLWPLVAKGFLLKGLA